MPQTIEITAAVEKVYDDGGVVFEDMCSVYQAPPDLAPIFRAALAANREVKFTHARARDIVAAELMPPKPPTPLMRRLRIKLAALRWGLWLWWARGYAFPWPVRRRRRVQKS